MRLRSDIATTETDEGAVLLDERTGRYWQVNPSGAEVLGHLRNGVRPERIAADLAARYRIDLDQARADVTALTERLRAAGLVDRS